MNKKIWMQSVLTGLLILTLAGCSAGLSGINTASSSMFTATTAPDDIEQNVTSDVVTMINLQGDSIFVDGSGASVQGSQVTITAAGVYSISGTLNDGQVMVDAPNTDGVELILNGVSITTTTSAPIYVRNAGETIINLAADTDNFITDGSSYEFDDIENSEPNAAIFSKDDLTIKGDGALTVEAQFNNGIQSKDDLEIAGGNITISAPNNGIKGKDSVVILGGDINIQAGNNGVQASESTDPEKGFIRIEDGKLSIESENDGLQAETDILLNGGELSITSGGGSANAPERQGWGEDFMRMRPEGQQQPGTQPGMPWSDGQHTRPQMGTPPADRQTFNPDMLPDDTVLNNEMGEVQATEDDITIKGKGLKAARDITINGGTIQIDSQDDAIHANNNIVINEGHVNLTAGDDGMHADTTLAINDGDIIINKSYEGIESATLMINGGKIQITASDDGINAAGGVDGSSFGGRAGQDAFSMTGDYSLVIQDGTILIDAIGDGLDINGIIEINGGLVLIDGPTSSANGAVDYLGSFTINGGVLAAVGSSGMAMAASPISSQYSVLHYLQRVHPGGTLLHVETQDGEQVLTFQPSKDFQTLLFSTPELQNGVTYSVMTGGSASGVDENGLFSSGSYTPGVLDASFTITSMVTGESSMRGPGGGGGGRWQPGQ